jgi:hypothetical protein
MREGRTAIVAHSQAMTPGPDVAEIAQALRAALERMP